MRLPNWNLTFTTKRKLQRIGLIAAILIMVLILFWFCWVIWLERYVVYTREGAQLNFELTLKRNIANTYPQHAEVHIKFV